MAFGMLVEFHPAATAELESSTRWYAERSPTAAQNFLVAIDLTIDSIAENLARFLAH